MRTMIVPAVAAALLSFTACDVTALDFAGGAHFSSDYHSSYPLNAGGKISIETFNGGIDVSAWDQNTVEVSATKYGNTQEAADDLQVSMDHTPTAIAIRVERPSGQRGGGARFTVQVPRGTVLALLSTSNGGIRVREGAGPARLRTSNGSIRVTSLNGSLEASTSNGGINADLASINGPVRCDTSNGGIDLRLPADLRDDVRAETSNGGITVHAPEGLNARISAHTSNARITNELGLSTQNENERNRLEGVVGKGGPHVELSTSNGGIHLLKM